MDKGSDTEFAKVFRLPETETRRDRPVLPLNATIGALRLLDIPAHGGDNKAGEDQEDAAA
jgi:hypothetical protein